MNVLIIGSGGREHAIVWKISQSKKVGKIYCAPGNPGIGQMAQNIPIQVHQLDQLVQFAKKEKIDLTVVGSEAPLIGGIVDLFQKNDLPIIGPSQKAARIEGSKVFAKKLMLKYKIPTANFAIFDDYTYAKEFLKSQKYPLVIKAEGQCFGKGVCVCQNEEEARKFIKFIFVNQIFGDEGKRIVIEECLEGQEVSFMVASDGDNFVSFLPSQDHKRVFDGDRGPNTGGMGAYAPVPYLNKRMIKRIEREIVAPTLEAMRKEGCPYKGILYPGLILTNNGPKVLEYNCRFGDPETQPLMRLLKTDLIGIFEAVIEKRIKNIKLRWHKGSSVCVVLTSKGYPGEYEKGQVIRFSNGPFADDLQIFQAGTKEVNGKIITGGGRVLGVTARGKDLKGARRNVYQYIGQKAVHFSGMHYRKDIGKKGLVKKLWY